MNFSPASNSRSAPTLETGRLVLRHYRKSDFRAQLAIVGDEEVMRPLGTGALTAEEAAMAKWWCTELQKRVVDRCLQLHGGYGYMLEYPIARAYADARITTIYGGTTEIMKEIIGRSMGV